MTRNSLVISLLFLAACSGSPQPKQESAVTPAPVVQAQPPAPPAEAPSPVQKPSSPKRATPPARVVTAAPPKAVPVSQPPAEVDKPKPQAAEPFPTQVVTSAPVVLPPPPPPEPVIRKVVIPSGTLINVRMIDSINSDTDHVGQSFKASVASPVTLDNETVIPRNADVFVKLVSVRAAGNMTGTSELKVQLDRISVGKTSYVVESNTYIQTGSSQTTKTAKTVGIGTAIGAAIGAITGGKKGAAIGAGVGAGGGAAVEAATKGEQVRIESESPLTFRLEVPIEVTLVTKP